MLELFVVQPERLAVEDLGFIERHLHECTACKEQVAMCARFYREVESQVKQEPGSLDVEATERISRKEQVGLLPFRSSDSLIHSYARVLESKQDFLVRRVVGYIRNHPGKAVGYSVMLVALLFFSILFFRPTGDRHPFFAIIKSETLEVYNRNRKVVWTKSAKGLPDFPPSMRDDYWPLTSDYYFKADDSQPVPVRVFDIDGDGVNEVLISGGATQKFSPDFPGDTLYCFNSDGRLRWSYSPNKGALRFGSTTFSAPVNWRIHRFVSIQSTESARVQLFVASNHEPSWPAQIAEVDPVSGKSIQVYYHAGGIGVAVVTDIEGDGTRELVFGGINNGFNRVCLIVFNPFSVSGVGPTSSDFAPTGLPKGSQKAYLLMPRTDLIESEIPYNTVNKLTAGDQGGIVLMTDEGSRPFWNGNGFFGGIVYTFDAHLTPANVIASSPFEKSLERAKREGLIRDFKLDSVFYSRLRNSIEYWDGNRFVIVGTTNDKHRWSPPFLDSN